MLRNVILSSLFTRFFPSNRFFPKGTDFSQKRGFFGEVVGKALFPSDSRRIFAPAFSKIGAANE